MAANPCLRGAETYNYLNIFFVWHRVPTLPNAQSYEVLEIEVVIVSDTGCVVPTHSPKAIEVVIVSKTHRDQGKRRKRQ